MPVEWTSLPLYPASQAPPFTNTIGVYTHGKTRGSVVYKGYICPITSATASQKMMVAAPTPRISYSNKLQSLRERMRVMDKEFETRPVIANSRCIIRHQRLPTPLPLDRTIQKVNERSQAPPVARMVKPREAVSAPSAQSTPCTFDDITYPLPEEILEREISLLNLTCVNGMWYPADVQDQPAPSACSWGPQSTPHAEDGPGPSSAQTQREINLF